jgi:outer membrane protein OmpA-like peptidoglycan-associated protein
MKQITILLLVASLAACQTAPTQEKAAQHDKTIIGAASGAVAGALIDHDKRARGALIGAAVGAGVGYYMDSQEKAYTAALDEERRRGELEVERVREDLLKMTLSSEASFDFDKSYIKPAFQPSLDKLADVMIKYNRSEITIIGHTDSIGSDAYNQRLSEERARAVKDYLVSRGVAASRMTTVGRGESEPRDTNSTEAGRQLNRRVEILIKGNQA